MNNCYLLDTIILIGLLKGMDFGGIDNTLNNEDFFLFTSAIVVGELYYGISDTNDIEDNRSVIQEFITPDFISVLDCDRETAFYYVEIKRYLQARKLRIPENDIWIAATARQHNLILVTRDKSFDDFVGISIQKW